MRHAILAGILSLFLMIAGSSPRAVAFEIDQDSWYGPADSARTLTIVATADTDLFVPLIEGFLALHPGVSLRYTEAPSVEIYRGIADEGAVYDLVISSAMDLQMKLANDGYAREILPVGVETLPTWARWRNMLYAVAQEPAVLVLHEDALAGGLSAPRTRRDLIELMRDHAERFRGRVGTYDPVTSGVGYMFATQDARMSDTFWRLAEVIGRMDPNLYCCSFNMLDDLRKGRILLAYNVIGSYTATHLRPDDPVRVIELEDFTLTLLRTALVPVTAREPDLASEFISFLISPRGRRIFTDAARLPPIDAAPFNATPHLRPIRLDPGLLAPLDQSMRRQFLQEWQAAMEQP